ncbi:hypothetical protein F5X99DRAFT_365267 [Biscogniauxia marginata]|nr:hypothetical protein F5X99DRAFT_365267 [Biscogniauxia marginata]
MTMDLHMDLPVGFDEDFAFGGQPITCSSSSGSFSSASTRSSLHGPFTPTSGRSTPGVQPVCMDHDTVPYSASRGFELTPPASTFGSYFPSDVKSELNHYGSYDTLPETPTRKASIHTTTMDFEYPPMMSTHLASQNHFIEHTNPQALSHYQYMAHMGSSPMAFHTPPAYTVEHDGTSMWDFSTSPAPFYVGRESPASLSPVKPLALRGERNSLTPSCTGNHEKRYISVGPVQQKSSALHQAQYGIRGEVKQEKGQKNRFSRNIQVIAKGTYRCDHPECIAMGRNPFKRQEHLKRHKSTCHNPNPEESNTECPFCKRCFNRKDNWRQHLKLHTKPNRAISRTDYHPEAKALYDAEMKKTKQRSQSRKKSVIKDESD